MVTRGLSITKYDSVTGKLTDHLYDCIDNLEDAQLLAQYVMKTKKSYELVVIMPGWNMNLTDQEMQRAVMLAEKYNANY